VRYSAVGVRWTNLLFFFSLSQINYYKKQRNASALFNRGSALDSLGLFDDAIADFTKVQLNLPKPYLNRCALDSFGLFDDAIADFT
jgi:hypothetical protein